MLGLYDSNRMRERKHSSSLLNGFAVVALDPAKLWIDKTSVNGLIHGEHRGLADDLWWVINLIPI